MRKLALGVLLCASASAQVSHFGTPTGDLWGTRDKVTLLDKAGHQLWSVKLGALVTDFLTTSGKVLVNTIPGVVALDARTGRILWQTHEDGVGSNVYDAASGPARGWDVTGEKVYWSYTVTNGAYQAQRTNVYSLRTGEQVGYVSGNPWLEQGDLILFQPDRTYNTLDRPEEMAVTRWNPKTGDMQEHEYWIDSRPSCGPMSTELDDYGRELSGPYLLGARRDNCGAFVARVAWAKPSGSKVEILPLK